MDTNRTRLTLFDQSIIENFLFKLDGRMVKVGPNLIKKIGWSQAA